MLIRWELRNFKSIKHTELHLKPLTVLAGANSSGKSSILHSILLICQTLNSKVTDRALAFNGEFVKLGAFEDVLHHSADNADKAEFGIAFTIAAPGDQIPVFRRRGLRDSAIHTNIELTFTPSAELKASQGSLLATLSRAEFRSYVGERFPDPDTESSQYLSLVLRSKKERDLLGKRYGEESQHQNALAYCVSSSQNYMRQRYYHRYRPSLLPLFVTQEDEKSVGVILQHFVPRALVCEYDAAQREFTNVLERVLIEEDPVQLYLDLGSDVPPASMHALASKLVRQVVTEMGGDQSSLREFRRSLRLGRELKDEAAIRVFSILQARIDEVRKTLKEQFALELGPLPEYLDASFHLVKDFFTAKVRYLGPLRDEPKPIYEVSSSADTGEVGIKGQFTAAVLDIHRDDEVVFWNPEKNTRERGRLLDAVIKWLQHFGILYKVRTRDEGKLGHRMYVQPTRLDAELDLTNVGFGVSQVLPIVVMSLVADQGSTLLFEQPELHLHPKVQSRLADFFVGLVRCGKQAIVETHSEYLINRLRLRIAEDIESEPQGIGGQIGIYFVDRVEGHSRFTPVVVNQYGAIPDWPSGFFDEGPNESDRIIEAGLKKKLRRKRGHHHDL